MDKRGVLMVPPLSFSGNSKQTRSRRQVGRGRVLALATACLGGRWHPPLLLPLSASISHHLRARVRSSGSLLLQEADTKHLLHECFVSINIFAGNHSFLYKPFKLLRNVKPSWNDEREWMMPSDGCTAAVSRQRAAAADTSAMLLWKPWRSNGKVHGNYNAW